MCLERRFISALLIQHLNMYLQEGSDNSGTLMDSVHNQTLSSIHGDDDDTEMSLETSEYEDPPGSVIDLRHVSRASFQSKLTPRIHRRVKKDKTTGLFSTALSKGLSNVFRIV